MTDRESGRIADDHKAEIIDHIYDVAVDPARYERLLDIWEQRIAPLRRAGDRPAAEFRDAELEQHLARASLFLDRLEATNERRGLTRILARFGRAAAFASFDGRTVAAVNEPGRRTLLIQPGEPLDGLPVERDDVVAICATIRDLVEGATADTRVLRARSTRNGGPVIFRARSVEVGGEKAAVVVTSELAWPAGLVDTMREAFDLTLAEMEIVRAIAEGSSIKAIAHERGRSVETVRTQMRSILSKTEARSQSELVRITLGLMDVVSGMDLSSPASVHAGGMLSSIPFSSIALPDGRRLDFLQFGDPAGRPCLFLPQRYGLVRWPVAAEAAAERRGVRVVVPVRAGYGQSSPLPKGANCIDATAADMNALLDHMGVDRVAVLSLGADLRFAMRLAAIAPGRVTAILGCAAMLPLKTPAQYDRMDKWQRFILANARYAPRVLPFLVKAGFSMARRIGKDRFFRAVNGNSAADIRTFSDPEVREAMLVGSDVCLSEWHSAHEAYARETIDGEGDWSDVIRACPVPVTLLNGGQDPQAPASTMRELAASYPAIDIEFIDDAGQLIFFQEWPHVLNRLEAILPERRGG